MKTNSQAAKISRQWAISDNIFGKLTGDFLEVVRLPEKVQIGFEETQVGGRTRALESKEEIMERAARRARLRIRQLVNCNRLYVLHTLTYAVAHPQYFRGERPFDIVPTDAQKDRDQVIMHWQSFRRRMQVYAEKKGVAFEYVTVIEKHTGKRAKGDVTVKQDTYHIHFVSNRVWGKRLLQAKWKHGFCNFADWTQGRKSNDLQEDYDGSPPDNPGAYMSKYVGKDMECEREDVNGLYKKRYWASQHLLQPVSVHGEGILDLLRDGYQVTYTRKSDIEVDGRVMSIVQTTYHLDKSPYAEITKSYPKTATEKREKKAMQRLRAAALTQQIENIKEEREYERKLRSRGCGQVENVFTKKHYFNGKATRRFKEVNVDRAGA